MRDNGVEDRLEKVEGALQQVLSRMQQDADSRAAEEKRREIEVCAPHCCVCFMAILRAGGGGDSSVWRVFLCVVFCVVFGVFAVTSSSTLAS